MGIILAEINKCIILTSTCNCKNISPRNNRSQPSTITISITGWLLLAKHWSLNLSRSSIQRVQTHQNQNTLMKPGTGKSTLKGLLLAKAERHDRRMRMEDDSGYKLSSGYLWANGTYKLLLIIHKLLSAHKSGIHIPCLWAGVSSCRRGKIVFWELL